jgi:subtilisin family serine protease
MIRSEHSFLRRLGTAGMIGVASFGAAACPAPPPPAQTAHVVVLDEFPQSGRAEDVSHGTLVEQVLRSRVRGDVRVERQQVSLGASLEPITKGEPGGLERYVVQRFSVPVAQTARALQSIEGPAVASQSQGASESRVVDALWGAAQNPATRAFLEAELELEPGTSDTDFLQALVRRVDDLHGVAEIRQAQRELRKSASEAAQDGVIHVVSAGNNGELDRKLEQLGVIVSRDFYSNDLATGGAIVVGAADHRGTAVLEDDGPASLASPNAGATVAAYGVHVPIHVNGKLEYHHGSSYAQPQVAGMVAEWLVEDPSLTGEQATQRLLELARPVPGAESQLGYGIVGDPTWQLAR